MKHLECHEKEPELYSEDKGTICYFEKLHSERLLVIVTGTEDTTRMKIDVVCLLGIYSLEEKRDHSQVYWAECPAPSLLDERSGAGHPGER